MDASILKYVTGPIQLIGMVMVILAALVPQLTSSPRSANQRTLIFGLLALGALSIVGGVGLELARSSATNVVSGNVVSGTENAVGVDNSINGMQDPNAHGGKVSNNRVTGDDNAVGVGNRVDRSLGDSP
jgi:hypothetical protein